MNNYDSINDLDLQTVEYGKLLKTVSNAKTTRTLKIAIPKIMSLGNNGAKDYTIAINRSLVLNDNTCIKKIPTAVWACNYMEVPLTQSAFRGPYREDKYGKIRLNAGETIKCIIPNKNIKDIKATDM